MKRIVLATIVAGMLATGACAQAELPIGLSGGTTPPTPDCSATLGQPVLLVRNLIEGATLTGIYVKPYSDYSESTGRFLSVGSFVGGQINLLGNRQLQGKKTEAILGDDDANPGRCGTPINFGAFGYRKTCSADLVENLYQITAYFERGGKKLTVTATRNVCDETMLDFIPGVPSDDSDKVAPGAGLSGATPDCETTAGTPKLQLRNLIDGSTITNVRTRPISDYNRVAKAFTSLPKGAPISSKSIAGKPISSTVGSTSGRCGTPINFGQFDFRTDCPANKLQNLYEMTVTIQRGDKTYATSYVRNVCDETMLDIAPGTPAVVK